VNEPVDDRLVMGVAELDDDVVDRGGEPRITNQRQAKCMPLLVAMVPFTQGHDIMRLEHLENAGDGLDWHRRSARYCGLRIGETVGRCDAQQGDDQWHSTHVAPRERLPVGAESASNRCQSVAYQPTGLPATC
jgi:hypothetical protein